MTIRELITELEKLDLDLPVCGQSETNTWDMKPEDIELEENLSVFSFDAPNQKVIYAKALILGYRH